MPKLADLSSSISYAAWAAAAAADECYRITIIHCKNTKHHFLRISTLNPVHKED